MNHNYAKRWTRLGFAFAVFLLCGLLKAQETPAMQFRIIFNEEELIPGNKYFIENKNDSVSIEKFRFYISNIRLIKDEKIVYSLKRKHFLVDIADPSTCNISLEKNARFNSIRFEIGIDSATNSAGALGKDLDPVHGMYWAWQSGYINWKIEGYSDAANTRDHLFQFHVGGYHSPYNTLQQVELKLSEENSNPVVAISLDKFFTSIDIGASPEIMSPGAEAISLARIFATIFTAQNEK